MEYPNWFAQSAQYNFDVLLQRFIGEDNLHFLQLGAYTGDATVWLRENILTGAGSLLQDVDTWKGSNEEGHKNLDFNEVYEIYQNKISKYDNIWWYKGTTFEFLSHVFGCDSCESFSYDFIYIDADHTTVGVLLDAEMSWPLLKSGGLMAFDDYTWHHHTMDPRLEPKVGIDLFLHRHTGEYELLAVNDQVWIRKQ